MAVDVAIRTGAHARERVGGAAAGVKAILAGPDSNASHEPLMG
jgi:hypothetical protein